MQLKRYSPADRHHSASGKGALPLWVAAAYEALLWEAEKKGRRRDPQHWERLLGEFDRAAAIFGDLLSSKERKLHAALNKADGHSAELQKVATRTAR